MNRRKRLRINLKPGSIEEKRKEFVRDIFNKVVMVIGFFLVFILIVNFFLDFQIHSFKKRLSSIEKEWEAIKSSLEEREYLLEWKDKFYDVFTSLQEILRQDLPWSSILKSLSNLVPAEMWFRELSLREERNKKVLEIKASIGYLSSDEDKLRKMNSFLESAKKDKILSENFEVPDLKDITKVRRQEEEVIDLEFSFTSEK
ncbi:MAG TPA: hypothetical protein ENI31_04465 [Candidatus Omnitrophica bacterium]|nr:hypothetical protein [Candidatus Omnitrophota bacterium]